MTWDEQHSREYERITHAYHMNQMDEAEFRERMQWLGMNKLEIDIDVEFFREDYS